MITNIVLADNQHIVREGVRTLLEKESDFRVVGEAKSGREACQLVRKLKPDILVLELMMDGLDGIEATRYLSKHMPRMGIVILSMYGSECYVVEALRAGAEAYVLKQGTSEELVTAIRKVVGGKRYLSQPLSERAFNAYADQSKPTTPLTGLTARERDVFHLAAQGLTNAQIAEVLYISRRTAEFHRARMLRKLGLRRQIDLIRYAIERGISTKEMQFAGMGGRLSS